MAGGSRLPCSLACVYVNVPVLRAGDKPSMDNIASTSDEARRRLPNPWPALLVCMSFPTLMSLVETRWILPTPAEERTALQTNLFVFCKILQFALPLAFVLWSEPRALKPRRPSAKGMLVAIGFSLVIAVGMWVLYFAFLRGTPMFAQTAAKIDEWLEKFNFNTAGGFLTFALVISVVHSLLEEYYWRWFVFGWLTRQMSWVPAALISSLAFMSHHVVVLAYYLPGRFWIGVMPFSLCVAVGGFVWAWLYWRSENLYAAWLSHLLIDAAIMVVGWDLLMG